MTNGDFANLDEVMDIESHNVFAMAKGLGIPKSIRWKMIQRTSRDNARTPMQWTGGDNAGFSSVKPWLKVNRNHKEVNVEKEKANESGVLSFWKKMIEMRKTNEVLLEGDFTPVLEGKRVYAFERELGGKRLLSVCNMSGKTVRLPRVLDEWDKTLISSYNDTENKVLKPFEFRLMERR